MSNVNNYKFAEVLKTFEAKMVIPQRTRVANASKIMNDPNHHWTDINQRIAEEEQLKSYKAWSDFYETFLLEGNALCLQHETLVNHLSKWYDKWRNDISNEGVQEIEIMSMQAEFLNEIFSEMYKELQPLNLAGVKPPAALNMK